MVTPSNIIAFRTRAVQFVVPAESYQARSDKPLRILIIGGMFEDRMALRLALEAQGFILTETDTGERGLAEAAAQTPDCIVLDHHLPDFEALQLLDALRAPTGRMPCAIVIMTDSNDSGTVAALLISGALDHLVKDRIDEDSLRRVVRGSVERYRLNATGQAMEERNRHFAAIVENSTDAIFSLGLDNVVRSWNHGAMDLFGYSESEAIGKLIDDLIIPPDLQKERRELYAVVVAERHAVVIETRRLRKDGGSVDVEINASPLPDAMGGVSGISVIMRDITDRKQAEAALRDASAQLQVTNRRFEMAMLNSPITAFEQDLDLRYTWIHNPRLGFDHPSIIGRTDDDIVDAAVVENLKATKRRAIATGLPVRGELAVGAAGGPMGYFELQVEPRRDADGRIVGIICISSDLTERKCMEDTLRASEERLRLAADAAGFGLYEHDPARRISFWSGEMFKIFGLEPADEVHISTIIAAVHPDDRKRYEEFLAEPADERDGDHYEYQYRIVRNGETRWVLEKGQAMFAGPAGSRYEILTRGTIVDISARVRAEEHNILLTREVNHRSKNLLAVVLAVARQTAKNTDPSLFVDQFSNRIAGLSASLDLLVKSEWQGTDIRELVCSQLAHYASLIGQRVTIAGPALQIRAEAAQAIGMALHELSTNAAKYGALSDSRGTVNIAWDAQGEEPGKKFMMTWTESEGPPCQEPKRRGFGYTVMVRMTAQALDAEVSLTYPPSGLNWHVTAPAASVLSPAKRREIFTFTPE